MKPQINVITLAVDDLDRAVAFYRDGLGLPTAGIVGDEFAATDAEAGGRAAMFTLESGLILSLYSRSDLAKDAGLPPIRTAGSGFSLGYVVSSRAEVDALLDEARAAGGEVPGPAGERPWGIYSGYFADPDRHLWEAVYFI